ncbi:MAG: hypothetical protein FWH15_06460 [Betaproteobacteria bacterium]|nr:hypothetical protein [Betaproteobacteria bacterium]
MTRLPKITVLGSGNLEIVEVAIQGPPGIPGAAAGAVRFDLEQALTEREQARAQANLDLPWNYALFFNASLL